MLRYDQNTTIVVEDGGIIAKGAPETPIIFTASAASTSPGFYTSAVSWGKKTTVNSALTYSIIQYADIALDIAYGAPDISYSLISKNAQSGIYCRNGAAPTVSFSTLTENRGEGALTVVGNARPRSARPSISTPGTTGGARPPRPEHDHGRYGTRHQHQALADRTGGKGLCRGEMSFYMKIPPLK